MSKQLDYIRNWTAQDGTIRTTYYVKNTMLASETEEEFIKRCDQALIKSSPEYADLHSTLDKISDMPDFTYREKFRRDSNGKVWIDHSVQTQGELREIERVKIDKKKDKLRQKLLKISSDLTVEDIDLLLER